MRFRWNHDLPDLPHEELVRWLRKHTCYAVIHDLSGNKLNVRAFTVDLVPEINLEGPDLPAIAYDEFVTNEAGTYQLRPDVEGELLTRRVCGQFTLRWRNGQTPPINHPGWELTEDD